MKSESATNKAWLLSHDGLVISSITTIDTNIKNCYKDLFPDLYEVNLSDDLSKGMDNQLYDFEMNPPDFVVVTHPLVIDHPFFKFLLVSPQSRAVTFFIHIYGDFIRRGLLYCLKEPLMLNKKIKCFFPSTGYLQTVQPFFKDEKNLGLIHVPVEKELFFEKGSEDPKEKVADKLCFIYSGRISSQKNVKLAAQLIKEACAESGKAYQFLLCGTFDDFEGATIGSEQPLGTAYADIMGINDSSVIYLGPKKRNELKALYQKADVFISLSIYHDESYGLSPLEALMSGTSCLLSDWGGYKDYAAYAPEFCQGLKLKLTDEGFEVSPVEFKEKLQFLLDKKSRNKCSEVFQKSYDKEAVKKKIMEQVDSEVSSFQGFSEDYHNSALVRINDEKSWTRKAYQKMYNRMWE